MTSLRFTPLRLPQRYQSARCQAAAVRWQRSAAHQPAAPHRCLSFSYPAPRTLSEIVHTDKLLQLPAEEVSAIWQTGAHNKSQVYHAVIPAAQWATQVKPRLKHSPRSILPVLTNQQAQPVEYWPAIIEAQDARTLLVTSVSNYQAITIHHGGAQVSYS